MCLEFSVGVSINLFFIKRAGNTHSETAQIFLRYRVDEFWRKEKTEVSLSE